jgi:hypothetical protein
MLYFASSSIRLRIRLTYKTGCILCAVHNRALVNCKLEFVSHHLAAQHPYFIRVCVQQIYS